MALSLAGILEQFDVFSREGELLAIEIMAEQAEKYLNRQIQPHSFCRLALEVLQTFFDDGHEAVPDYSCFWSLCEYCEEETTFAEMAHLDEGLREWLPEVKRFFSRG